MHTDFHGTVDRHATHGLNVARLARLGVYVVLAASTVGAAVLLGFDDSARPLPVADASPTLDSSVRAAQMPPQRPLPMEASVTAIVPSAAAPAALELLSDEAAELQSFDRHGG